jgi:hypothetical protein
MCSVSICGDSCRYFDLCGAQPCLCILDERKYTRPRDADDRCRDLSFVALATSVGPVLTATPVVGLSQIAEAVVGQMLRQPSR